MSRSACEVCGETYDYCGECGTCHKCMGEDVDRLKAELEDNNAHRHELQEANKNLRIQLAEARAEVESKDKAVKLLQGHCNALMDTEGKLAQWKKGHTAGQEAAGYYQKQADDIIRQLRKELSDENANFTEEIMNLERQLDASQALLADARAEVERYKAGVEVEGYVAGVPTDISNDLYFASGWSKDLAHLSNKKVRVLIMKLEV